MTQYAAVPFHLAIVPEDTRLIVAFRIHLKTKGLAPQMEFTSDDLRAFLDVHPEYAYHIPDIQHGIGTFMAKLRVNGFVEYIRDVPSRRESNHGRKVDLLRWVHP